MLVRSLTPDTLDLDGDEDFEEVLQSTYLEDCTQDGKPDLGAYEFGDVVGKIPLILKAKCRRRGNVEGESYYEINRMTTLRAVPREGMFSQDGRGCNRAQSMGNTSKSSTKYMHSLK